jgi:glucuronosyltransferase
VCGAAKILGIFPSDSKSHAIIGTALMRELANRGHHITMLSQHPQTDDVANYTDIVLKASLLDILHNGKIVTHLNELLDGWMVGWMDGWMDRRTDE